MAANTHAAEPAVICSMYEYRSEYYSCSSTTEQLHVLDLVGYRLIRRIFECMEASVLNVFNRSLSLSQIKQIYHAE